MRYLGLKIRTAVVGAILTAFYLVAVVVMMVVFGQGTLPIAIVDSLLPIGFQYKVGEWTVLRNIDAEDLPETQYAQIYQLVKQVCDEKNMKKPSLKIASMGAPDAFAIGCRSNGTVVVSRELIQLLDRDEFEGAVAHELTHTGNHGVITVQLGQGVASMVAIVAQYAVLFTGDNDPVDLFLAIIVGQIVQFLATILVLAISRYREYVADADAEHVISSGDPLVHTLEEIQQGNQRTCEPVWTAQQSHDRTCRDRRRDVSVDQQVSVLCISSPDRGFLQRVVSTHPPMKRHIERLRSQTPGLRELLVVVLSILLGIGLFAAPRMALRPSVFVGSTRRRHGDYGTNDIIPGQWTWIIHGLGATSFAVAASITYQAYI